KPVVASHLLETIQAICHGPRRDASPRPVVATSRTPLHVLLAEDNAVNRKVAVRLLQKRGHTVVAVEDGRQAVRALDRERFDVVLMDVQMPEMDGFEATAAVRARERVQGRHVPIVALTAHAAAEAGRRLESVGRADDLGSAEEACAALERELQRLEPELAAVGKAEASAAAG